MSKSIDLKSKKTTNSAQICREVDNKSMKNNKRYSIPFYFVLIVISVGIVIYGLKYEHVTEERIRGPVKFQQNWECTVMLSPKIDTGYSLELQPEINDTPSSSKKGVFAAISFKVIELPGNKEQNKKIVIKMKRMEGDLVVDGDDPLFFETRKGYNYKVVIHVDKCNFNSADVDATYYMSMDYMDVAHHNIAQYCILIIGGMLFVIAVIIAIFAVKR